MRNDANIAIIELFYPIEECHRILKICYSNEEHGTPVSTCGLGSTSGISNSPSRFVREILLKENKLFKPLPTLILERLKPCPDDLICTTRVTTGANSCFGDEGNPLYLYNWDPCHNNSVSPLCLYGVATGYHPKRGNESDRCGGGSYFARMSHFAQWLGLAFWHIPAHAGCGLF